MAAPPDVRDRILAAGLGAAAAAAAGFLLLRRRSAPASALASLDWQPSAQRRALLVSNSSMTGLAYLDHVEDHVKSFFGPSASMTYVLFVPYALKDMDGYAAKVKERLGKVGYSVRSLHEFEPSERLAAVEGASAIFVGGGNTYRLLKNLQRDAGLMDLIRRRVNAGSLKYMGSSAGTNVACPTIRNTNDMPIVWPPGGLSGLCLVPFQINTHYIDREREVKHHMGETRETRLNEFAEENAVPLVALREGSAVLVQGDEATLLGPAKRSSDMTWDGAVLRLRPPGGGKPEARELTSGESLSFLMRPGTHRLADLFDVADLRATSSAAGATNG